MPRDLTDIYSFHPLERFTFKQRLQIRLYGLSLFVLTKSIGMTIRFETFGNDPFASDRVGGEKPILAGWHDRSVGLAYRFRNTGTVVLSSSSFDSEYTARCLQRYGFGIIKGSSSRGAVGGLIGMVDLVKRGYTTLFTVDGPRGPRYEAKAGPVLVAKKTGSPLVPFVIEFKRSWTIGSWDKLLVPKPFTKAAVFFGEPIYVSAKADEAEMESKRIELQSSLDDLVERGRQWRSND